MTKQEILKSTWVNLGRWMQPTISGIGWTYCHDTEAGRYIFPGKEFYPLLFLDGYTLLHASEDKWYAGQAKYFVDPSRSKELASLSKRLEEIGERAERRHMELLTADLPDSEYARELFDSYREMTGVWWVCIPLCAAIEDEVMRMGYARSEQDLGIKVAPYVRQTWLERQSAEIRRMAGLVAERFPNIEPETVTEEFINSDSELKRNVEDHVKEFIWFGTHHWNGEPYTVTKCIEDIRAALLRGPSGKPAILPKEEDEHELMWRFIALCMYWRTHCAEATAKVTYGARECLTEIARQWNMSYDDLTWLSGQEILRALEQGQVALPKDYLGRRSGYGAYADEDIERIIVGAELAELIDSVVPKVDTSVSELKGITASKGNVVKATARVIMAPSDFARFEAGDILIANETTPDFVPLMKKAAAIVTDTGGITSHAAIVSRELKVPCITGTEIATRVFKDGDFIEVDTESGIVRYASKE